MAQKVRRWTREDLERLPDDGNRYEVVRGELFVTPAPRPAHDAIVEELADSIAPYVAAQSLGRWHPPTATTPLEIDVVAMFDRALG